MSNLEPEGWLNLVYAEKEGFNAGNAYELLVRPFPSCMSIRDERLPSIHRREDCVIFTTSRSILAKTP
jgi:hypothetical protein